MKIKNLKIFAFMIIAVLLIVILISVILHNKSKFPKIENSPETDVEKALRSGDNRFLGIMGIGLIVPGVPDYQDKYSRLYGVKIIPFTGDAINNTLDEIYQKKAYQYALEYNMNLLKKLGRSPP